MKYCVKWSVVLTAGLLLVVCTSASASLTDKSGLSGEISINIAASYTESNLNTEANKRIESLHDDVSSDTKFAPLPLSNIAYTFGQDRNQQLYAGASRDDIAVGAFAVQLGYQYELPSQVVLDFTFLPTVLDGKVWGNPYLVNSSRKETDEGGEAYRLEIKNLIDGQFTLDMAYASRDIEKEQIIDKTLLRDADIYRVRGVYSASVTNSMTLQPSLTYTRQDAVGRAESFDGYSAELSLFKVVDRHQFALTVGYKSRDYDAASLTFHKVRDDDALSVFTAYEYKNVFDWKDWSFISLASVEDTNSNIHFFDKKEYLASVGFNYHF